MRIAISVPLALCVALAACAKEEPKPAPPPKQEGPPIRISFAEMPPTANYPLKTCVVTGEPLRSKGAPYVIAYKGYEVQFCCKECIYTFQTDPEGYVRKVNPKAIFPEEPK
jgi:YHS domain-containing protein